MGHLEVTVSLAIQLEDLCRKINSERYNTAKLEKVWNYRVLLFCFSFTDLFVFLFINILFEGSRG